MDIGLLLRAAITGGADFGQRREVRAENNRAQTIEDAKLEREKTEALLRHSLLTHQLKAAQAPPEDPTRYATHEGRKYDLQDPGQKMEWSKRTAKKPEAPRAPLRGSPEYLQAIEDEERVRAQFRPRPTASPTPQRGTPEYLQMLQDEERARAGAAQGGIGKLPVTVQEQIVGGRSALTALDNYETVAAQYLKMDPIQRTMAGIGDPVVAQLKSAQNVLMLQVKELAKLGALTGPDLEIMQNMIGDPTALQSRGRSAEYTLVQLGEARKFIQGKLDQLQSSYGYTSPAPAAGTGTPAPTKAPSLRRPGALETIKNLGGGSLQLPDDPDEAAAFIRRGGRSGP